MCSKDKQNADVKDYNTEDLIMLMSDVSEVKITKLTGTNNYFISIFPRNTNVWFYKTGKELSNVLKECLDELIKLRFM